MIIPSQRVLLWEKRFTSWSNTLYSFHKLYKKLSHSENDPYRRCQFWRFKGNLRKSLAAGYCGDDSSLFRRKFRVQQCVSIKLFEKKKQVFSVWKNIMQQNVVKLTFWIFSILMVTLGLWLACYCSKVDLIQHPEALWKTFTYSSANTKLARLLEQKKILNLRV